MTTAAPFDFLGLSNFALPLSGAVNQRIATAFLSPSFVVNYEGNARIEERIVSEVASFGRQIGWLSELVLELAGREGLEGETLGKLRDAQKRIAAIKANAADTALEKAEDALRRLEQEHPEQHRALLEAAHARLKAADRAAAFGRSGS